MSRTLVISDNDILNQLYVINLEVYLATQVHLVTTTELAISKISDGEKFDLVITMNMINGHESSAIFYDFLLMKKLFIPMIIIGQPENEIPGAQVVSSSFNLQNLVRKCAQVLNVTAKSMADLNVPEYYPVSLKVLKNLKEVPCPLYLQMKKGGDEFIYTMISKKSTDLKNIILKLSKEGVETLYVDKVDRLLVVNHISNTLSDFIKNTDHLEINDKSAVLQAGFEFAISEFTQSPEVAQEIVNIANASTKLMEEIIKEATGVKELLNILTSNKDGYIYTHSLLASYVADHIVKKVSWGGEGHIEKINFVLFFHDIMLAPLYLKYPKLKYEEDLLFNSELSNKEKEIVLHHPRLAAEMVMSFKKIPMGVDLLIKQHHGMTNGVGFTLDFKDDISPLSKIVLISEAFVEEFMKGKDQDPHFQIDIKKVISELNLKFKRNSYKKIILTLESLKL